MARFLALIWLLSACEMSPDLMSRGEAGATTSAITGIAGAYSDQRIVSDHVHYRLAAQVFVLSRDEEVFLTAIVSQVRIGGQSRLRMRGAWRDGEKLPFRGVGGAEPYCIAKRGCTNYRTGTFTFSGEAFRNAMSDGYRADLFGPDAVVALDIPAELFRDAAEKAQAMGML